MYIYIYIYVCVCVHIVTSIDYIQQYSLYIVQQILQLQKNIHKEMNTIDVKKSYSYILQEIN